MLRHGRVGTSMRGLFHKVRSFKRDERGSVTIQVIFFSLMVFGATGVVLDAGRVYDTHSRIQIFADHMAHVAANELDRKEDSIDRARNAVYAAVADGQALLTDSDPNAGTFNVDKLDFYSDMLVSDSVQNDMSEAFPASFNVATVSASASDATAEGSIEAAFVVVTVSADIPAVTRLVTQTIPDLGYSSSANANSPDKSPSIGPESYDIQVKSAATLERTSCAELTTLVMCNPWEDQSGAADALSVPKPAEGEINPNYTVPGRSLMYFAPNFQNALVPDNRIVENGEEIGSLFPWDVNHQLMQIDSPVADPAGVCSDTFLLNLAGDVVTGDATSQEYLDARDRCLMARAEAPQVCWSDENPLTIRPANGDTVLRSINTIFDIWNEPFETMVSNAAVLDPTGTLPYTAAEFFQPDRLATTTYETADRFGALDPTLDRACTLVMEADGVTPFVDPVTGLYVVNDPRLLQDDTPDYNRALPCDVPELDPSQPNAGTAPAPGDAAYDVTRDESDPSNATPDSFQPAYDTIPKAGWTYMAGTRGEGIGYDFCHDKTLGRQDTARQTLTQCLQEAETDANPIDAALQCETDYALATSFDTCAAEATPGRERAECGCEIDFVGDHHEGGQPIYMFARALNYRNSLYDWTASGLDPNAEFPISFNNVPMTWHEFYLRQRDLQEDHPDIVLQGQRSRVAVWNGIDPVDSDDPQNAIADYGIETLNDAVSGLPAGVSSPHSMLNEGYQKHFPDDFFALTNGVPASNPAFNLNTAMRVEQNRARREIQAAMVNCSVVAGLTEDDDGNIRAVNDDGTFNVTVDDMKVMQAYIPNPAGMFCGPDTVDCEIADSIETSMYIELIEDVTDEVTTDQYTVRLVR